VAEGPHVTSRKIQEPKVMATEDAVFGYRPPSSRKFMNSSDEPDDEDLLTDSEPTKTIRTTLGELRRAIVAIMTR